MTRVPAWLFLLVVATLTLAACGGGPDQQPDQQAEPPATPTAGQVAEATLDVWIMQPGSDQLERILQATADEFEAANRGVTVDLQFVPWTSAHDRFVTAVGGGRVPDLAEMGTTWTPEFAALDVLAPVDAGGDDFVESVAASATVGGKTYGYPWYAGARTLIYRRDVLERVGANVPGTWGELLQVGQKIADQTDLFPFGLSGQNRHLFLPLVWQAGGEIAVQQAGTWKSRMGSPEAVEAFAFYKEMWDRNWAPDGAVNWTSADVRDAFANGDIAMIVGGGWDLAAILDSNPELKGKIGTALTPAGPGGSRAAFAGGSHLVVFEQSDQHDLAKRFARFMLQPDRVATFAQQLGFLPATASGIAATGVKDDPLYQPFARQLLDHSRTYPPSPAWGKLEGDKLFINAMQSVLIGKQDVSSALADVARQMDAAFTTD